MKGDFKLKKSTKDTIQWHPAFQASIQIEFEAEAEKLTFEPEHLLSKKPMQMMIDYQSS